tara:strand:- start:2806 stop:3576 length:771 start_codon:yes stop_codon:yes gene_type:complete
LKWLKHDTSANRDAKLKKVIIKYGMAGYGLYWFCLEEIGSNVTESKFTFELESDSDVIARDTGINSELVSEMMTYMVNLGLFENQSGLITCLKMLSRLDQSMTSNAHMRNIISSAKKANNPNTIMIKSDFSHDKIMTKSCPEESREDESIKAIVITKANDCPHQEIINLYLKIIPTGIVPKSWTGERSSALKTRWREDTKRQNLEWWEGFFQYITESPFLMGKVSTPGRKVFPINLPWILKSENFNKIRETFYHDK